MYWWKLRISFLDQLTNFYGSECKKPYLLVFFLLCSSASSSSPSSSSQNHFFQRTSVELTILLGLLCNVPCIGAWRQNQSTRSDHFRSSASKCIFTGKNGKNEIRGHHILYNRKTASFFFSYYRGDVTIFSSIFYSSSDLRTWKNWENNFVCL